MEYSSDIAFTSAVESIQQRKGSRAFGSGVLAGSQEFSQVIENCGREFRALNCS